MAGVKGLKHILQKISEFVKQLLFSALVALAFTGSIGLLFLFLACALPQFK